MEINKEEILTTYRWIKVPKYKEPDILDNTLNWQEEYKKLLNHHIEETTFLINKVREIVSDINVK